MGSPLQVAIMLQLVDQRGEAPTDRWGLFNGYYQVISTRERAKPGPVSVVLRTHKVAIDEIHYRAGLLLQTYSEHKGAAKSYLTKGEFEALVRLHMTSLAYEGSELENLVSEIISASTHRLIFLVQRVQDQVTFEVRSLQEFMAAAQIMAGPQQSVQARLREIARPSHWRHVFQIAASKAFSAPDAAQFRDTVLVICDELNGVAGEKDVALVKAGAALAVQLLEDGVAQQNPAYRRQLFKRALEGLDLGPAFVDGGFIEAALADCEAIGQLELKSALENPSNRYRWLAAWRLAFALRLRGREFAKSLAEEAWQRQRPNQIEIAAQALDTWVESELPSEIRSAIVESSYDAIARAQQNVSPEDSWKQSESMHRHFPFMRFNWRAEGTVEVGLGGAAQRRDTAVTAILVSIDRKKDAFRWDGDVPPGSQWDLYRASKDFIENPTAGELSRSLMLLSQHPDFAGLRERAYGAPWPLAACILEAAGPDELQTMAAAASRGEYGSSNEWKVAEDRMRSKGVNVSDFNTWTCGKSLGPELDNVGVPAFGRFSYTVGPARVIDTSPLTQLYFKISNDGLKTSLALAIVSLYMQTSPELIDVPDAIAFFSDILKTERRKSVWFPATLIRAFVANKSWSNSFIDVADQFGRMGQIEIHPHPDGAIPIANLLLDLIKVFPHARGLLAALMQTVIISELEEIEILEKLPPLECDPADTSAIRNSVGVLRYLASKTEIEIDEDIMEWLIKPDDVWYSRGMLSLVLSRSIADGGRALEKLRVLGARSGVATVRAYSDIVQAMRAVVGGRQSALSLAKTWDCLALPAGVLGVVDFEK